MAKGFDEKRAATKEAWHEYGRRKQKIAASARNQEEYDRQLKQLIEKMGL